MSFWQVKYFDGHRAEAILAKVTIDAGQLIIRDQFDQQLDIWTLSTIQYDPNHLDYKFLMTTIEPDARIEMLDADMMTYFESLKKTPWQKLLESKNVIILGGFSILGCFLALFFSIQPLSRYIAKKIPLEYEKKLGQELNYENVFPICKPTKGPGKDQYAFILKLKQLYPEAILELGDLSKIKVIAMAQPNAFALPGGFILITDKFINEAKSYEEIAGVIAHEQGHINNRHHLQALVRGSLLTASASLLTGDVTSFVLMDPSTMVNLVSLKFSREDEAEADQYAVDQVLAKMNLSSQGLIDFFARSEKSADGLKQSLPGFVSTHPASDDRIAFLKKYLTSQNLTEIDPDDNINVLCH